MEIKRLHLNVDVLFDTLMHIFYSHADIDMLKQGIAAGFALRLHQAMLRAGLSSSRSKSGVCIQSLTTLTHHSRQMCRKYLSGEALPEPQLLIKLAEALDVSAGWLLFGETASALPHKDHIQISKPILHYILTHQENPSLFKLDHAQQHFLIQLIQEISKLDGDEAQLKKIIDLAFSSANQFQSMSQRAVSP